jgi:hypothetical protein
MAVLLSALVQSSRRAKRESREIVDVIARRDDGAGFSAKRWVHDETRERSAVAILTRCFRLKRCSAMKHGHAGKRRIVLDSGAARDLPAYTR